MFDSLHRDVFGTPLRRLATSLGATTCLVLLGAPLHPALAAAPVLSSVKPTAPSVAPGAQVSVASAFQSPTTLSNVIIDLEVRDRSNRKVFQKSFASQTLTARTSRGYTATWAMPWNTSPDMYTIKTGVFSSDWGVGYGWNDNAATFKVALNQPAQAPTTPPADGASAGSGPGYYVDCNTGNDASTGADAGTAWRSLARANNVALKPGDTLNLARGCSWTGTLNATWNGTVAQPIVVAPYGTGELPTIVASPSNGVVVTGSYIVLDGLSIKANPDRLDPGCNNQSVGYRVGVLFNTGSHDNTVRNSTFSSLSMGVFVNTGSRSNSIDHNAFSNVNMMFTLTPRTVNQDDDGGAQAILLEGDNNDVGYNTVSGSISCSYDYGTDGAVVEIYGGGHNTIHDNASDTTDIFSEISLASAVGNTFSYNIANGHAGMTVHGETSGTKIYNSVFYSTGGWGDNGVVCGGCNASKLTFKNNIVWGIGGLSTSGAVVDEGYNVFWASNGSPYLDFAKSSTDEVANPMFVIPGQDFRLLGGSPAIDAGTSESVTAGFRSDIAGEPVGGTVDPGTYAF
jgi:hypothetical protein